MPSKRAASPRRTSSLPTKRRPHSSGPRGDSRTQSSAKWDMIASRSCRLKASKTCFSAFSLRSSLSISSLLSGGHRAAPQMRALAVMSHQHEHLGGPADAAHPVRRPRAELGGLPGREHEVLVAEDEPQPTAEHVEPLVP